MTPPLRTPVVALVVILLALGVVGFRLACSPNDYQDLVEESRRKEDLHERERAILRRRQMQEQAVEEWIAQRCTLAETMKRLQDGDRELEQLWPAYYTIKYRTETLEEDRLYQIIRKYVEAILHEQPEELDAVRRRLDRDFQQFQANRQRSSSKIVQAGSH